MSSSENTLRLGLVDLPTLTGSLAAAGFHLFGGGPFREAAAQIKAGAEQGIVSAIFVADRPQPGIKAWLTRMAGLGAVVVILRDDQPRRDIDDARSVDLPATVGELLAAAGLSTIHAAAAAVRIGVDGQTVDSAATHPVRAIPAQAQPLWQAAAPPALEPASAPAFDTIPVRPPAVQATPVLFADKRRAETRPPAETYAAQAAPVPGPIPVPIPVAVAASPWDDAPTAPAGITPATPAIPAVRPPSATGFGAASPWDEPAAAAAAAPPVDFIPAVHREEDWFGQAVAGPSRTQEPPADREHAGVAQSPYSASTGVSGRCHASRPIFGENNHQPTGEEVDPWGQRAAGVAAPVAVLTKTEPLREQSKHDVPSPVYVAPAAPVYAQPVYGAAPEYADPQDAVDAMFAAAAPPQTAHRIEVPRRIRGQGSLLAIVCAEKGGVGKTNTTLALAQRAADRAPNRRVVLVDMNRGQGDIRKYLKLGGAQVPSILDAAISGNIADAVLSPEQITAARHTSLPPISFGVVLAPEPEAADPRVVTPDVYQRVIDLVRDQADLVIVDTQIIEIHDTSGLVDGLIVPALAHDAFGVTLTDTSAPGVSNLVSMLKFFAHQGVPANRLMIMINRALAGYDTNVLRGMLSAYGTFTGAVEEKAALARSANMGRIPHEDPSLAPVLDTVLLRVTGWPCFQPAPAAAGKKRFFGRKGKN